MKLKLRTTAAVAALDYYFWICTNYVFFTISILFARMMLIVDQLLMQKLNLLWSGIFTSLSFDYLTQWNRNQPLHLRETLSSPVWVQVDHHTLLCLRVKLQAKVLAVVVYRRRFLWVIFVNSRVWQNDQFNSFLKNIKF